MCITHRTTSKHQKQPSTKRTVAKVHFLLKLLSESCSRLRALEQTAQWLTTRGTDTDTNNTNKHWLSLLPTTRGTDWSKISTDISIKHCNININAFHWDKQWLTCMQLKHSWNIGRQSPIIGSEAGHQVGSHALPHCLELSYWHYQLVLSWYLHQPESHQLRETPLKFMSQAFGHCP